MQRRSYGFTLLEILIVLMILGVIAGLAVPAMQGNIERVRSAEALHRMKLTRDAVERYFAVNNTFVGASIFFNTIDFDPNDVTGGQTLYFTYSLRDLTNNTYTVRATRNQYAGCNTIGRIDLDHTGNVNGTGAYTGIG